MEAFKDRKNFGRSSEGSLGERERRRGGGSLGADVEEGRALEKEGRNIAEEGGDLGRRMRMG